ncbi:MAG: hypothetical protein AB7F20_09715 [Geoalkalibacter sp.]|jgi:hypothetical protein|uniref:hypothetical protein n=1 Tax=Geoalkalibacter sp. TaxID=3041440 RepID=UPI002A9D851A|nr:hypothetical protein [Thermodesulfobacteriota bacterium]
MLLAAFYLWCVSALATVALYTSVSLWFDHRLAWSEWIRLWLAAMIVLGPLGTLLTLRFLASLGLEVHKEMRRHKNGGERIWTAGHS